MAYPDWKIRGPEVSTCNCNWGCPCQFNSLPTHGDCRAAVAMRIDEGHFRRREARGVLWAGCSPGPGDPLGNGEGLIIIDEPQMPHNVKRCLAYLVRQTSQPGATIFNVFAATYDTVHDPVFAPSTSRSTCRLDGAVLSIPGYVDGTATPIANPITGSAIGPASPCPQVSNIAKPNLSAATPAPTRVPLEWTDGHGHIAMLHMRPCRTDQLSVSGPSARKAVRPEQPRRTALPTWSPPGSSARGRRRARPDYRPVLAHGWPPARAWTWTWAAWTPTWSCPWHGRASSSPSCS